MEPLLSLTSHIAGKNAKVQVFPDRVEWNWAGWMSTGAKAATALATGGLSYLATGVRGKRGGEVIPIGSISYVAVKNSRLQDYVVITSAGGNVEMRVSRAEANRLKDLILELIAGRHPSQLAPVVAAPVVTHAPVSAGPSLEQLAQWHAQGILSDEEFSAAKAKALGL